MDMGFNLADDEMAALELVKKTNEADILVHLVVEEDLPSVARQAAAEKLLKMWREGRRGGVTLDHLVYVADHADEPHKSDAEQIIRDR